MSEHILDLYCIQLSNTGLFSKNYATLYFDAKHLEKGLNRVGVGGTIFGTIFSSLFWPMSNAAVIFFQNILFPKESLEYTGYIHRYLPKLNSGLELVSGAKFLHIFSIKIFLIYNTPIDQVSLSGLLHL